MQNYRLGYLVERSPNFDPYECSDAYGAYGWCEELEQETLDTLKQRPLWFLGWLFIPRWDETSFNA